MKNAVAILRKNTMLIVLVLVFIFFTIMTKEKIGIIWVNHSPTRSRRLLRSSKTFRRFFAKNAGFFIFFAQNC